MKFNLLSYRGVIKIKTKKISDKIHIDQNVYYKLNRSKMFPSSTLASTLTRIV